ncbi:MAG TPA: hypothetical protein DCS11_03355 [Syntrophus sp. (in: bacteria)]|nr:hypothetical protein [Syntrophus sp. (in: bacteria)]
MGEYWQLFVVLAGLVAAWSGIMIVVQRALMCSQFDALAARIEEIRQIAAQNQGLERQLLQLKADLPLNYVRKEDFIRHEVVINTKLDRLRDLIEDLKERSNG